MAIGIAIGFLRVINCQPNCKLDIVPADYCINAAISAAWLIAKKYAFSKIIFMKNTFIYL